MYRKIENHDLNEIIDSLSVSLDLSNQILTTNEIKNFCLQLKINKTLKYLNLRNTLLGDEYPFAEALSHHESLLELDLSHHRFSHCSVEAIVKILKTNTTITRLNIAGCVYTCNNSIVTIINALQENVTLKFLDLSHSYSGHIKVDTLIQPLRLNRGLLFLDVSSIGYDIDTIELCNILKANKSLLAMNLFSHLLSNDTRIGNPPIFNRS